MKEISVHLAVIGSGPAGQKAAIQAAKVDKDVLVVEKLDEPGGNCLFNGTIPSKTLREAILDLTRFHERNFYGQVLEIPDISIHDLNYRLQRVVDDEKSMISRQFRRNGVRFVQGLASFADPHTLLIFNREGGDLLYRVKADHFLIATGSKPRNPEDVPFDDHVILDSTRLLGLEKIPKTMIVLGGGIIGAEYASFFAALDTEVMIVDRRDHILPMIDTEIGVHLQTALTDLGMKFKGGKVPEKIERVGDLARVTCDDGTVLEAEALLFALGRTANVDTLAIEKAGVALTPKGYVRVNQLFQTTAPHIYAVGDVIGGASLASTSMEQGRLASRHAVGLDVHYFPPFYPIGIYSIPEISSCGRTEDELREKGYHYEVGRAYYYELARSHIVGSHVGMLKILFHAETLEILGVHIIGRAATELIHIGQLAMSFGAKVEYFIDHVFNYPTYAEAYRVAALNGRNKLGS